VHLAETEKTSHYNTHTKATYFFKYKKKTQHATTTTDKLLSSFHNIFFAVVTRYKQLFNHTILK